MARNRYEIFAEIAGIDKITRPMNRMQAAVRKSTTNMRRQFLALNQDMSSVGKTARSAVGLGGSTVAVYGLGRALGNVITQGAEFEHVLTGAWARFGNVGERTVRQVDETFQALEMTAAETGATTEFTASQAAGALDSLARAGFDAESAMVLLGHGVDFATTSGEDLNAAMGMAVDLLGAFRLRTDDAGQNMENMERVMNLVARTANSANTSVTQMYEAIIKGAPAARAAGATIESLAAFTGVVANAGLKASDAGTAMKNVFLKLADKKIIDNLRGFGVESFEVGPRGLKRGRDFADILADLGDQLAGLTDKEAAATINEIFGLRGVTAVSNILANGIKKFRAYRDELTNSDITMKMLAATMRATRQGELKGLESAIEAVTLALSVANDELVTGTITALKDTIRWLGNLFSEYPLLAKFVFILGAVALALVGVGAAIAVVAGAAALIAGSTLGLIVFKIAAIATAIAGLVYVFWDFFSVIFEWYFKWLKILSFPARFVGGKVLDYLSDGDEDTGGTLVDGPSPISPTERITSSYEKILESKTVEFFFKGNTEDVGITGATLGPGGFVNLASGQGA